VKTIVTITGIRPDFIRMSEIFKKLDNEFNHILVHTGQHYDSLLSDVFFKDLEIRKPDYNLNIGGEGKKHYHQTADLSVKIIELIENEKLNPDLITFLGDSNSVVSAVSLKKEGYKIAHIEAGMRSYDKRMLEEINRTVCDHCSDYLFVYHEDYKEQAIKENIPKENIFVVGNTIVEVANSFKNKIISWEKHKDFILMDIHRPENFQYPERLKNIFKYANKIIDVLDISVQMLSFHRTMKAIKDHSIDIGKVEMVSLVPYRRFLELQYHALFLISDSGTAQEEASLFNTPVIVPRDFTERPQSVENNCSFMIDANKDINFEETYLWVKDRISNNDMSTKWLGEGNTSDKIINILHSIL
jgi:UDP-N-acetylglucosamine 2-epimerase (non-hydrolysing)